jgi:hypothetical protein
MRKITKDNFFDRIDQTIADAGHWPALPCRSCGAKFTPEKDEFGEVIVWSEVDLCNMCVGIGPR